MFEGRVRSIVDLGVPSENSTEHLRHFEQDSRKLGKTEFRDVQGLAFICSCPYGASTSGASKGVLQGASSLRSSCLQIGCP